VSVKGSFQFSSVPSWKCFVNGNALTSNNVILYENNVELCALKNFAPKATPSNLTVVASGTTTSPFLFDRVEYVPDASVILDNSTIVVNPNDGSIEYYGWNLHESSIAETSMANSFLIFEFVGALRL
jgi:hypothetical protein